MKVKIIAYTPQPEKTIAAAAKLCYSAVGIDEICENLTPDNCERFLRMLMDLGHESPVEHVSFTFAVEGVSRSLLAQLTRHRIASYSVQSQRYVGKENFEYILPPEIEKIPEAKALFIEAMEHDRETYRKLDELLTKKHEEERIAAGEDPKKAHSAASKQAHEDARYVLSNACDTKIVMTMNVRSLYHFFSLRCCNRAQWEIRALAREMLRQCREVSPLLFSKAGPGCLYGACPEGKMTCGKAALVRKEILGE